MQKESQTIEIAHDFTPPWEGSGVCFDSERAVLTGLYSDELSAFRARRMWTDTLEIHFLLDEEQDFTTKVSSDLDEGKFVVECHFKTACARYAFWRLTNNQAPEVQYVIETAHIPICESRHNDILRAPDMRPVHDTDDMEAFYAEQADYLSRISKWLKTILRP